MAAKAGAAILGWGSLLWEDHEAFNETHGPWKKDGPLLKIEFSRISSTRLGALTLVIDPDHGQETVVSYCLSSRKNLDDTIADLRCREGTVLNNIGYYIADKKQYRCRDQASLAAITQWAKTKRINSVVWTDLPSNFAKDAGKKFSTECAIDYIQGLSAEGKVEAAEYIWRAPHFVKTPLRAAFETVPWFKREVVTKTSS